MNQETRTCQNCKQSFGIAPDDVMFYEKVSPVIGGKHYVIPLPRLCPSCRMQRRMSFRNERVIYKRTCDSCGKDIISVYHPEQPFTVYCYDCFYSDAWDPLAHGRNFDFSRPFFEQFWELELDAPKLAIQISPDIVNSEYVNHVAASKNCYLTFASVNDEDCMYCNYVSSSRNVVDGLRISYSDSMYDCVDCHSSYNLKFSQQCRDCHDGWFLYNCRGCSNCFLSTNLINKSYYLRNKPYPKEEYLKIVSQFDTEKESTIQNLWQEFAELKRDAPRRAVEGSNNVNSTGNYLTNTKQCHACYDLNEAENCRYVAYGDQVKDTMDAYAAYPTTELCYEMVGSGAPTYHALFTYLPWEGSDLLYCINTFPGCRNCFGCNQIRNKEYCVLNRQYSKEEYEKLVPKIIKHMEKIGEWGEFFSPRISPFGYNETIALNYFPLDKDEAVAKNFRWSDYEPPPPEAKRIVKASDLPDSTKEAPGDITECALVCEASGRLFRVTKPELEFYRHRRLPLPRRHPDERHKDRLRLRLPMKLWERTCDKCGAPVQSSYAPQRPEKIYCELCFKKEMY